MIDIDKTNIDVIDMTEDGMYGKVIIEPLERGFGITLGNSLRRVMLSSLAGVAVTSIKINGVQHEFSTITGIKEDIAEIILNVKGIRFKFHGVGPKKIYIEAHGKCEVTAENIAYDPEVEVLNPQLHIATLSEDASLIMELVICEGEGYVPADKNKQDFQQEINSIAIDSIFTPVKKVKYSVEDTRVGKITDYDKLTLEIWTDGSLSVKDAISIASKILIDHLKLIMQLSNINNKMPKRIKEEVEVVDNKLTDITLDELDLSVRAFNCLKRVGINYVKDLINMSEEEVLKIKNLGKKSLEEVIQKVNSLGFKMFEEPINDE